MYLPVFYAARISYATKSKTLPPPRELHDQFGQTIKKSELKAARRALGLTFGVSGSKLNLLRFWLITAPRPVNYRVPCLYYMPRISPPTCSPHLAGERFFGEYVQLLASVQTCQIEYSRAFPAPAWGLSRAPRAPPQQHAREYAFRKLQALNDPE